MPELDNVIQIVAGKEHALALKNDGTVWAWGFNQYGQLGNGVAEITSVPRMPQLVTNLTSIVKVSAGESHSIALKSDGTVWAGVIIVTIHLMQNILKKSIPRILIKSFTSKDK